MNSFDSPSAIAAEMGARIRQARLNADFRQEALSEKAGVSVKVLRNAEQGKVYLENLMAILQALDLLESIDLFLPPMPVSPIQLAKLKGKVRVRASGDDDLDKDSENEEALGW